MKPEKMKPGFYIYMDCSTSHIAEDALLRFDEFSELTAIKHEHGWWLLASEAAEAGEWNGKVPQCIIDIVIYARKHDAQWINIDADAEVHEGITNYWD